MGDLNQSDKELIAEASEALKNAYAPYSKFRVGAAVKTDGGTVYRGCNVENSSYGLTNCAERTAIFKAVSDGEREFDSLAIVVESADGLGTPCGSCRQVLSEFNLSMDVIMANTAGEAEKMSAAELLPKSFAAEQLDQEKINPK